MGEGERVRRERERVRGREGNRERERQDNCPSEGHGPHWTSLWVFYEVSGPAASIYIIQPNRNIFYRQLGALRTI